MQSPKLVDFGLARIAQELWATRLPMCLCHQNFCTCRRLEW